MTVTEKLNGYGPLAGIKVVEMCTYVAAPATVPRPVRDGRRGHQDRVLRRRYPAHPGPRLRLRADRYGRSHHRFEQHQQELGVAQPEGSRGPGHREEDDRRGRHLHEQHAHRRPEEARTRLRDPARGVPGADLGPDARLRRVRRVRPCPRLRCRVLGRPRRRGRYLPREGHLPRHPPAGLR